VSGAVASVRNWPVEASRSDWPVGQSVLDGFIVERRLGEGGMGMVYLLQSLSTAKAAPPPARGFRSAVASPNRLFRAEMPPISSGILTNFRFIYDFFGR
jgi:hypothetical protein